MPSKHYLLAGLQSTKPENVQGALESISKLKLLSFRGKERQLVTSNIPAMLAGVMEILSPDNDTSQQDKSVLDTAPEGDFGSLSADVAASDSTSDGQHTGAVKATWISALYAVFGLWREAGQQCAGLTQPDGMKAIAQAMCKLLLLMEVAAGEELDSANLKQAPDAICGFIARLSTANLTFDHIAAVVEELQQLPILLLGCSSQLWSAVFRLGTATLDISHKAIVSMKVDSWQRSQLTQLGLIVAREWGLLNTAHALLSAGSCSSQLQASILNLASSICAFLWDAKEVPSLSQSEAIAAAEEETYTLLSSDAWQGLEGAVSTHMSATHQCAVRDSTPALTGPEAQFLNKQTCAMWLNCKASSLCAVYPNGQTGAEMLVRIFKGKPQLDRLPIPSMLATLLAQAAFFPHLRNNLTCSEGVSALLDAGILPAIKHVLGKLPSTCQVLVLYNLTKRLAFEGAEGAVQVLCLLGLQAPAVCRAVAEEHCALMTKLGASASAGSSSSAVSTSSGRIGHSGSVSSDSSSSSSSGVCPCSLLCKRYASPSGPSQCLGQRWTQGDVSLLEVLRMSAERMEALGQMTASMGHANTSRSAGPQGTQYTVVANPSKRSERCHGLASCIEVVANLGVDPKLQDACPGAVTRLLAAVEAQMPLVLAAVSRQSAAAEGLASTVTSDTTADTSSSPPADAAAKCCGVCGAVRKQGGVKLRVCTGCRSVRYCSEACQTHHWQEGGHRRMCKQLEAAAKAKHQPRGYRIVG